MKEIRAGNRPTIDIGNANPKGFVMHAICRAENDTTLAATTLVDLAKVNIKVKADIKGTRKTIYDGDLLHKMLVQNFDNSLFKKYHPISGAQASQVIKLPQSGPNEVRLEPIWFDFEQVYNLNGEDKITVEVHVASDVFAENVDTVASHFQFQFEEGVGLSSVLTVWDRYVITANTTSFEETLGDNIQSITFLNLDSAGTETELIREVDLDSDKLRFSHSFYDLIANRVQSFEDNVTEAVYRQNCFEIFDTVTGSHDSELDNGKIELDFISSRIEADKNVLVVKRLVTNPRMARKARQKAEQHRRSAEAKVGV